MVRDRSLSCSSDTACIKRCVVPKSLVFLSPFRRHTRSSALPVFVLWSRPVSRRQLEELGDRCKRFPTVG